MRGFFLKDKAFELEEQVATTIAQIACDGVALPQGSPCSPVISELIGHVLDIRLLRFAKKYGVRYSRYVDDITFSTNQGDFPKALAVQDSTDLFAWTLGGELIAEIESASFKVNIGKTRMHYRRSRQMVTGLVVNEKVNIRSEYYRNARAMCDSLFQTGQYFRSLVPSVGPEEVPQPDFTNDLNPLEGILSHIYAITQSEERRDIQSQRANPRAIRALYRRFLFYKYCIALETPLIITEGKTDPIYLREAIRYRSVYQPRLGEISEEGFRCTIRFFNYEGQAHEIMDLGGGSGDLRSIILDYQRNLSTTRERKPVKFRPNVHPVILLLDNDAGLKAISNTVNKIFGTPLSVTTKKKFYHVTENLYIIKTPEDKGESCIEDMFPKKVKETVLNGKKFNKAGKIESTERVRKGDICEGGGHAKRTSN